MQDSMAQPGVHAFPGAMPAWKPLVGTVSAVILAALFLLAGVWKITDPIRASASLSQALVPRLFSLPLAIMLGISETVAGVMLLVPRFRRWGAWLSGALLVAFVIYVGWQYQALQGEDCSCFPWLKRTVGPGFFVGDGIMLLLAGLAGWWARPSESRRGAALVTAAVAVFALVSFGVHQVRSSTLSAPALITLEGKPFSMLSGRVFLYFFDPECTHCTAAARQMAGYRWKQTRIIAVPTRMPQFSAQFLQDTGLRASVSNDLQPLRKAFSFGDPPYGVALENGRRRASLIHFDEQEPRATLNKLGFID